MGKLKEWWVPIDRGLGRGGEWGNNIREGSLEDVKHLGPHG